jgi:hypothetical protein
MKNVQVSDFSHQALHGFKSLDQSIVIDVRTN